MEYIPPVLQRSGIQIYTDGACRGNPGKGGYGILLIWGGVTKEIAAGYRLTTNNRMELMGVIVALSALTTERIPVIIYTDSRYVVNSVQKKWVDNWVKTDFKDGKKNKDLWLHYYHLSKKFELTFQWVKGHANNIYNTRCDLLATTAADGNQLLVDEIYEQEWKTL